MIIDNKDILLEEACSDLSGIYDELSEAKPISIDEFSKERSALCIVDVVNGFLKFGSLADRSLFPIISEINSLAKSFSDRGMLITALNDSHDENSYEFASFPPHCIKGSEEEKMVDELLWLFGYNRFYSHPKGSTNAFLESTVRKVIDYHTYITEFIVVGDCTDICILQYALSLKAYGNTTGRNLRVVVPMNCVDTFSAPSHSKSLMNLIALKLMKNGGVEIVKEIIL